MTFSRNYGTNDPLTSSVNSKYGNEGYGSPSTNQVFDKILSEQDKGLDSLHNVIVRSRVTAQNIHSEVGVQNEIIDGLGIIRLFYQNIFVAEVKTKTIRKKLTHVRYSTLILDDDVERTTQHLLSTTDRVRTVDRTSSGIWKYWLVIAILFLAIVIVIAI